MKKGKKKNNTFKFQNFAERISNINIDVYHVLHKSLHEVPENDKDTFFRKSLENWAELNCSLDFTVFYREIKPYVQSFNQLVFHKDVVFNTLICYLSKDNSLSIEPCLDLVSQLSRDLLQDFQPYFVDVFTPLLKFLSTQDTNLIEKTFVCFAHIFKFTWRYMVGDLEHVFHVYKALLSGNQKQHIKCFAAESFAFLIRKTKLKPAIIRFLCQEVCTDVSLSEGIGLLLFHALKGVKGQLNSSATNMLTCCLELLCENGLNNNLIFEVLRKVWCLSIAYVTQEHSSVLLQTLCCQMRKIPPTHESNSYLLKLLNVLVTFKNGDLFDFDEVIQVFREMISLEELHCSTIPPLIVLLTSFTTLNIKAFTVEILKEFTVAFFKNNSIGLELKISFAEKVLSCTQFSDVCQSPVMTFFSNRLLRNVATYDSDKKLIFQFVVRMHHEENMKICFPPVAGIKNTISDVLFEEMNSLSWTADVEWLHIIVSNVSAILAAKHACDKRFLPKLVHLLQSWTILEETDALSSVFVFTALFKSYLSLLKGKSSKHINFDWIIKILRRYPNSPYIVDCLETYCSIHANKLPTDSSSMEEIFVLLKCNLSSPEQQLRLNTLHILTHFLKDEHKTAEAPIGCLQTCIEAEEILLSFDTFRDRLLHFQRLSFNKTQHSSEKEREAIVRVLIANLFSNLSIMWDKVIEILTTYSCDKIMFWRIWMEVFAIATNYCEHPQCSTESTAPFLYKVFADHFKKSQSDTRVDYQNFRVLLLKAMKSFSELVEQKSRDIVPMFLRYIEYEYSSYDDILCQKQDLRTAKSDQDRKALLSKVDRKTKIKTLCAYLEVFKLFNNPRALSKETKIHGLYFDLLTSKDNQIQTLAVKCLMTYKYPYLHPYKESFNKLMDDGTFRDELLLFTSGQCSEEFTNQHKVKLMPILIRLLYGKLQRKAGLGPSGKSSSSVRRNVIMQFLSNCTENDIKTFISLIVDPFKSYRDVDLACETTIDVSCVIPLRKQAGYLNMLSNIVTRLDKMVRPFLPLLFDNLLKIIWTSSLCLRNHKNKIDISYVGRLKNLRQLGVNKLTEMFDRVTDFSYEKYIDQIYSAVINPQVSQLTTESTQNVTPLLRLVITLSTRSQYHALLCYDTTILSNMYNILKQKALSDIVEMEIMKTSLNFLTVICKDDIMEMDKYRNDEKSPGVQLIRPFVGCIVDHISEKLMSKSKQLNIKGKQKIGNIIAPVQLSVLAKISEYVVDKIMCEKIVSILFPLLRCIALERTQVFIMLTIKNMLPYVDNTSIYSPKMPLLFKSITSRKARDLLCELYVEVTKQDHISLLVQRLNSWDKNRLDEPDFDQRLDTFRLIGEKSMEAKWSLVEILPILYNCLHFISTTEDMSIRDASTSCIEKIISSVCCERETLYKVVISQALLPVVKQELKAKKEVVRQQYLGILSILVKTFKDDFPELQQLSTDDPEKDFFENMKHIQVHRRVRALHQIIKFCEEGRLTSSTLFSFILPLISHAVFQRLAATKDHNILSETITAIGCITRRLPWAKYSLILKNYMSLLRTEKKNQKTMIRVVVAILNNFHFNINTTSSSDAVMSSNIENETEVDDVVCLASKNILNVISMKFLPQLQNFLKKKSRVSDFHKGSGNHEEDDEDILKIPVALAVVKLLQHLPKETMDNHLQGLLLRVSHSLRSHARDVREVARDTMLSICRSLGPSFLAVVVKEMRSVLLRGYQLHVLGYTLHTLLEGMDERLQPGGLDSSVQMIMEILMEEMFGEVAEEKEVSGITSKLHEARSHKSIECITIVCKHISTGSITEVIHPLKRILDSTTNRKHIRKVEETLRLASVGLHQNKNIAGDDLLLFVHTLVSNTFCALLSAERSVRERRTASEEPRDIFIVGPTPSRAGDTPSVSKHTNEHVFVEFGLQLLQTALKRQTLVSSNDKHVAMLDPFVALLQNTIQSVHVRIVALTARCLSYLVKFKLPAMGKATGEFAKQLFKILKRYANSSAGNAELISSAFKAMTVIIRDYTEHTVSSKQLQVLLAYVEEDMHNTSRHSTAFPLLKAILSRKLTVAELHGVMLKCRQFCVADEDEAVRLQCRQIMLQYFLDYPLRKKLSAHLDFFVQNLSYEEETGRVSSLEMLAAIFNHFPVRWLHEYSGYFFVPLVMMLTNDESALCRKMAAVAMKLLLKRLETKYRDNLFAMLTDWFKSERVLIRQAAVQSAGMFVEVEREDFIRRLDGVLLTLSDFLNDAVKKDDDCYSDDELMESSVPRDQLVFNILTCIGKIVSVPKWNIKHRTRWIPIWDSIHRLLLHAHKWVRLVASQLFGVYFGSVAPENLVALSQKHAENYGYLNIDTKTKVNDLCNDFLAQLKDDGLSSGVAEQATKNLIYLAKVVKLLTVNGENDGKYLPDNNENDEKLPSVNGEIDRKHTTTLKSLIAKMCKIASYESSHAPKETIKRTCVFRWTASLFLDDGAEGYLLELLRPIYREVASSDDQNMELKQLGEEVLELIRSSVGKDRLAVAYAELHKKVLRVREARKRKIAVEVVTNPQKFAHRKRKVNLAKRDQRKRKLYSQKPTLRLKKLRSDLDLL